MTALDSFIDQAWADHADDPEDVARRLGVAVAQVADENGLSRFSMLAHHVFGEHLGQWPEGLAILAQLAARGIEGEAGLSALARCRASLQLCAGEGDERPAMSRSEACRATGMAACNLALRDAGRASQYLEDALHVATGLPDADPAVRSLAASANNMAATLEEQQTKQTLPAASLSLMVRAAQMARQQWERAGGWREVERAEYRLALCLLAAGEGEQAMVHARLCESIVNAHGAEPLEAFFAAEAVALAAWELASDDVVAQAVQQAEQSFPQLPEADQAWCRATLERLRLLAGRVADGG